jgi:hypothetical protein
MTKKGVATREHFLRNEVGHVGIVETRNFARWADDLWARDFSRVHGCINPFVELRATSLLCL